MSSANDAHGDAAHGHDSGHDAHGGPLPPHEISSRLGIAAAVGLVLAAFALQFTLGPMGAPPAHEGEGQGESEAFAPPLPGPADLILTGGRVVAPGFAPASTVVVGGGKILAIGGDDLVALRRGPQTTVKDLHGAAVIPGLRDAHAHLLALGRKLAGRTCDLSGATSLEDVRARFAAWVKLEHPKPGEWLTGRGWDESRWQEPAKPSPELIAKAREAYARGDKAEGERLEKAIAQAPASVAGELPDSTEPLDQVAPENPVILYRADGHAAWVNHRALELAKITHETFDPADGKVLRDAKGEPTGVLVDAAIGLVATLEPAEKAEDLEADLLAACQACARAGYVEVQDAGVDRATENALRRLAIEKKLPIRVYAMIGREGKDLAERLGHPPDAKPLGGLLTVRSVLLFADGALESRGALLLEPYADEPTAHGFRRTRADELASIADVCSQRGYQLCVHAAGDAAARETLDVFEKVLAGAKDKDRRFRVESAQVLSERDLARFAKLGVVVSVQPYPAISGRSVLEARLGADRLASAAAWRTLVAGHAHLAFGSDLPFGPESPLLGLYAAVARQDERGEPAGGWRADERLTPAEALRAFTEEPAFAAFEDGVRGKLEPGQEADLTVLSDDPLEVLAKEPRKLLATRVVGVYLAGAPVGGE